MIVRDQLNNDRFKIGYNKLATEKEEFGYPKLRPKCLLDVKGQSLRIPTSRTY